MYPWVKAVLAAIILVFLGIIYLIFKDSIPMGNAIDEPAMKVEGTVLVNEGKELPVIEETKLPQPGNEEKEVVKEGFNSRRGNFVKDLAFINDEQYDKALGLFNEQKIIAARDLLWEIIKERKLDEKDDLFWQCSELLSKINHLVIFTSLHTPEKISHKIVSGDSYDKLARMYKTTVVAIQKSNNRPVDNFVVQLGRVFNIYPGVWSIKVIKHKFKLILFDQGRVFKVYDISTGKQNRTPVAKFKIVTKQIDPDWNPPGQSIKFGEEGNPLGTRWMGMEELAQVKQHFSYGIHGTWEPHLIGKEASNGCIRMENNDVAELYDIVTYGTEVTIVD